MSAETLRKQIFVGCRELGLDHETRHDLQLNVTGKSSLTDMSERELKLVVDALETKGFVVQKSGKTGNKRAPRADLRLVHVLWGKLGEAGALREPSRAGLNNFIRKQFGETWQSVPADVDMLRDHTQIDDVIQALKAWARREDVDFDFSRGRK
jgi:phage gp16-like protein